MTHIPIDRAVLHKWLKAGYMEQGVLYATREGTPQGGIISPVLANLALDGLERVLGQHFPRTKDGKHGMVHLVRYADDFIVTGRTRELLEHEVKPLVESFLLERGLKLSAEKTAVMHIEQGCDFLGQNVRKYNGKMLIKPSKKNVKAFLAKVRGIIKANKQAKPGHLIAQLNPVLRGWANYHRHVVSKDVYRYVDTAIFRALWQWARRRHPNKGARWVKARYWQTIGTRNWVFAGTTSDSRGNMRKWHLSKAADVPIVRHTKVRGEANPYDPEWEVYFERRLGVKMETDLKGRRQLLYLWKQQGGICPVCNQTLSVLGEWHNHHKVWRSKGGSDRAENRVLLHPNCHMKMHHGPGQSASVTASPSRGVARGLSRMSGN